jgi:hypothetical protein
VSVASHVFDRVVGGLRRRRQALRALLTASAGSPRVIGRVDSAVLGRRYAGSASVTSLAAMIRPLAWRRW